MISAARADPVANGAAADRLGGQSVILAILLASGFALAAPTFSVLLFGPEFRLPVLMIASIGVLQATRFLRVWPVTAALAKGRSGTVMVSNLLRLLAYPLALLLHMLLPGMAAILTAFILAELLALTISVALVSRMYGEPRTHGLGRLLLFLTASALVIAWAAAFQYWVPTAMLALLPPSILLLFWLARQESGTLKDGLSLVKRRGGLG
jgi:hypothetical protein